CSATTTARRSCTATTSCWRSPSDAPRQLGRSANSPQLGSTPGENPPERCGRAVLGSRDFLRLDRCQRRLSDKPVYVFGRIPAPVHRCGAEPFWLEVLARVPRA